MGVVIASHYRRKHGQMERVKRWKKKVLGSCGYHSSSSYRRVGHWLVVVAGCACTVGCSTLKNAGIVGLAGGTGALAGTVLSGGVVAPIVGATTTAFVADVVTAATPIGSGNMNDCAPDNFWTLLGSLVEMGGWLLILIVIIPMIFSWLLPGPIQFKKKNGS